MALGTLSITACATKTMDAPMMPSVSEVCSERSQAVFFATGSDNLDADARRELDAISAANTGCDFLQIQVTGYAHSVGSNLANLGLSDRRADAVVAGLVDRGVTADRIKIVPLGEATTADDGNADAFERRVVVTMTP